MPFSCVFILCVWYLVFMFWYILNEYPNLLSGARVYLLKINMAGTRYDAAASASLNDFPQISSKSTHVCLMAVPMFHLYVQRERERERQRERERERERLVCVWQYFYYNLTIVGTSVFWNTFCSTVWIFALNICLRSDKSLAGEQRCTACRIAQTFQSFTFLNTVALA
jgi:hypothetical protein